MAHHSLRETPGPGRATSESGSSRTTGWKLSSPSHRALLQHGHCHVHLDRHEPEAERRKGKIQLVNGSISTQKSRSTRGKSEIDISDAQIERSHISTRISSLPNMSKLSKMRTWVSIRCAMESAAARRGRRDRAEAERRSEVRHGPPRLRAHPAHGGRRRVFRAGSKAACAGCVAGRLYHRIGYEISFTRYFYEYEELRSVEDITQEILELDAETEGLLQEVLKT